MSEDSIERKKKIGVCFCIYMVAVLQRNAFYPDAAHISDLHLNILAPVTFLKFPMKMK